VGTLLDTNALVWFLVGSKEIGRQAYRRLQVEPDLYVSSLSFAELKMKEMRKKISLPTDLIQSLERLQVKVQSFSADHALEITRFGSLIDHDPFDRMILAQASAERCQLLTADQRLLSLDLDFVIDATR
jgi:PIN domain nuclease of toxin-antitoxin system